jgi:hypothetical protein
MTQPVQAFAAPWNRSLRLVTLIVALVCLTITASLWPVIEAEGPGSIHFWGGLLPVLIVTVAAVFAVKGYRLEGDELVVERLFWVNRFPLEALESVQPEPQLMRHCRSVLGNSGFCGFMGLFKHPRTGVFRALVTDPAQVLLLNFAERPLAISPGDHERFLAGLLERHPAVQRRPGCLGESGSG